MIDEDLYRDVKIDAARTNRSVSEIVEEALRDRNSPRTHEMIALKPIGGHGPYRSGLDVRAIVEAEDAEYIARFFPSKANPEPEVKGAK